MEGLDDEDTEFNPEALQDIFKEAGITVPQ
jgi:hypothetical protein